MFFSNPSTTPVPSAGAQNYPLTGQNPLTYSNYNNSNYYGQNSNIQGYSGQSPFSGSAIPNVPPSYNNQQQSQKYTSQKEQQLQYSSQPAPANYNLFQANNVPKQTFLPSNTRDLSNSSNQTATTLPQCDSLISDSNGNLRNSDATFQNLISQLSEATKSITSIVKDLKEYKDQHLNSSRSRSTTGIMQQSSGMTNSFDLALGQLKQNLPNQISNNIPAKIQNTGFQFDQRASQISSISQIPQVQNPCFFNNSKINSQIQQMAVSQYPPKTYILQSPEDQQFPENSARIPSTSSIYLPPSPNSVSSQMNQQQIYGQKEYNSMPKKVAVDLSAANNYKFNKYQNDLSGDNIQGSQSARGEEKRQTRDKNSIMGKSYFNGSQTIITHRFLHTGEEELIKQEQKESEQFEMKKSDILSKRIRSYTSYNEERQSQSQQLQPLAIKRFDLQGNTSSQLAYQN